MATNKITYSANDRAIVNALKNAPEGLTLAEINEATGLDLKPGSITSAKNKGLITVSEQKGIVYRPVKRSATVYFFITKEAQPGKDNKPANYTENELAVLEAASKMDKDFILADLSEAMGVKLTSGRITSLVKKGNIGKRDEKYVYTVESPSEVNIYLFASDIPADAE